MVSLREEMVFKRAVMLITGDNFKKVNCNLTFD
jgi:hypothetical protein